MNQIIIEDYHAEGAAEAKDPTAPEAVDPLFMNKLGALITRAEEALQAGDYDVDSDLFFDRRGEFLDLLQDPQYQQWVTWMRHQHRVDFPRVPLAKEDPETENVEETEADAASSDV